MVYPVCMLPQVQPNDRGALHVAHAHHQVVVLVVCLSDYQPSVFSAAEPHPTRQKSLLDYLLECLLEALEICKMLVDRLSKFSRWL